MSRPPTDPGALARARAALARATGRERLDLVLDQKDPAALVRSLPADELYLWVEDIGLGDAVELVQLASPAQFRIFLDLDCWVGDRLEPRKALRWLRAARAGALDDPRSAARWKAKRAAIDREVLLLLLRTTVRVHELERDPDPVLTRDRFMRTPEGKYVIEFDADGAEYVAVRGLVDDLYAEDPFQATRLLASLEWDLPSELEESALRWRTGRLADLGYPSREEALSWFARPSAASAPPAGTPVRPPGFFLQRIGTGSLLARAAAALSPEQREHLELELVSAANAVLVADGVDPGDLESARSAVAASRALVELGLAEAAAGTETPEILARTVATTAVKSLFQRGFGRLLQLKWRAERILGSGRAGTREAPALESPLAEVVIALARRRPLYYPGVELPREEWGGPIAGGFEARPFLSLLEVARTAEALAVIEERLAIVESR